MKDMALGFIMELRNQLGSRLRLPHPFARVMEDSHPRGLWLCVVGCCNDLVWVTIERDQKREDHGRWLRLQLSAGNTIIWSSGNE